MLLHTVSFLETIDTTARIYELLLAREERMALGANINSHLFFYGAGCEGVAAGTGHNALAVCRMYFFFHVFSPPIKVAFDIISHKPDNARFF